jgi:hypothetical protein
MGTAPDKLVCRPKVPRWYIFKAKIQFGKILKGLGMEKVGIGTYSMAIWKILWLFGIFYAHMVIIWQFSMLYQEKSGNPVHRRPISTMPLI